MFRLETKQLFLAYLFNIGGSNCICLMQIVNTILCNVLLLNVNKPHELAQGHVVGKQDNASRQTMTSKENDAQNLYTPTNVCFCHIFYEFTSEQCFSTKLLHYT